MRNMGGEVWLTKSLIDFLCELSEIYAQLRFPREVDSCLTVAREPHCYAL